MLYGQMEKELTQGEPWCPWHQVQPSNQQSHLVEPEQETIDIYDEALLNHAEQARTSSSNDSVITRPKADRLYQLVSYYLRLLM